MCHIKVYVCKLCLPYKIQNIGCKIVFIEYHLYTYNLYIKFTLYCRRNRQGCQMLMPKISVVIPVYNAEKYLPRCVDSLLDQSFDDFEAIFVDDGSTDESLKILQNYAAGDKRIVVIRQRNQGVSVARNAGINIARAPYISFVDADDYVHPEMFFCMQEVMEREQTDIVNCLISKTNTGIVPALQPIRKERLKVKIYKDPLKAFMRERRIQTGSYARLYKRSVLEGISFEPKVRYEDIPFAVQVMNKAKSLALIFEPLYFYFQHPESFIHQPFTEDKARDYFKVMSIVWQFCQKNCPEKLCDVRRFILNNRFKMLTNQVIRRQKDKGIQRRIFDLVQANVRKMYQKKMLSYEGLKVKHKIRLFLLLHCRTPEPCRVWSNLI